MNIWLLGIVTICYGGTGVSYFCKGQYAWGVFWMCYAIANTAFMIATK